jgi:hypothetical protein
LKCSRTPAATAGHQPKTILAISVGKENTSEAPAPADTAIYRRLSGLEYALRLDVADALGISLPDVLVDSLRTTDDGQTQVTLTFCQRIISHG